MPPVQSSMRSVPARKYALAALRWSPSMSTTPSRILWRLPLTARQASCCIPATSRSTTRRFPAMPLPTFPPLRSMAAAACWLCWRILPTRSAPALRQPSRLWPKGCAACLPAPKTAALSWQPLLPTSTASSRSLTWPLSMAARWPSMAAAWFPTPKWRGSWGICMRRIMC